MKTNQKFKSQTKIKKLSSIVALSKSQQIKLIGSGVPATGNESGYRQHSSQCDNV